MTLTAPTDAAVRPRPGRLRSRRSTSLAHPGEGIPRFFGWLLLTGLAITTVYPFVFLTLNSLKTDQEYTDSPYSLPGGMNWSNFSTFLFDRGGLQGLGNSLLVIAFAVPTCVLLATLVGYAVAKLRFRGKRLVYSSFVALVLVPGQVLIIPLFLLFSDVGLVGSKWSVFLAYVAGNLPFGVFLLAAAIRTVPTDLMEAARIDGAGPLRTLVSVVMPVARAGIMTFGLLAFQAMWNELTLALLLTPSPDDRLLTPTLALLPGRYSTDEPLLMAGLVVGSIPMALAVVFFARYLERGAIAGSSR